MSKKITIPCGLICGIGVAIGGAIAGEAVEQNYFKHNDGSFKDFITTIIASTGIRVASTIAAINLIDNDELNVDIHLKNRGGKRLKKDYNSEDPMFLM